MYEKKYYKKQKIFYLEIQETEGQINFSMNKYKISIVTKLDFAEKMGKSYQCHKIC